MHTRESLKKDIERAGLQKGDVVFIRISYKAVGKVEGGPQTVIDAILDVIGTEGTLLATAFPKRILSYKRYFNRKHVYYKGMKPTTGALPCLMAKDSRAFFSSNPISPYVVIGKHAEEITSLHDPDTDSYEIVKYIIERFDPKCLRIGGEILDGTAHLAFTEGLRNTGNYQRRIGEGMYYVKDGKREWKERTVSAFCYKGFRRFFFAHIVDAPGAILYKGLIGDGQAMVTSMKNTYLIEKEHISKNPSILICEDPNCLQCGVTFSFSNKKRYVKRMIKTVFSRDCLKAIKRLYDILIIQIMGKRCV